MTPNPGHLPEEATGKRVIVRLREGSICGRQPVSPTAPRGWAADGARWSLTGHPFDIMDYEVIR
jgi:hypothetical protein